jgi:dihydrofolate reductase
MDWCGRPGSARPVDGVRAHFRPQRRERPRGDVLDHWQNSTPITGDIIGEITRRMQQPGKNIMIPGSATLVRCLLREGLLDELRLLLFPLVLGGGERLFDDWAARLPLQQVELLMLDSGVLSLSYQPAPA